jgi:hypothetical protein
VSERVPDPSARLLHGDAELAAALARELGPPGSGLPPRIDVDPDATERGLAGLVVAIVDIVRQLLERQALRRMESGSLSDEQVERLGRALMGLEERILELRDVFGLGDDELRLPLDTRGL